MEVAGGASEESKSQNNKINDVHHSRKRKRPICICLALTGLILLLMIIIIVILAFTVYKPKRPGTTINSLSLDDFNFTLNLIPLEIHLNITLDLNIIVKNPNKVTFKYTNTFASLKYKDQVIGNVPIPPGTIKSDGSTPLNLTLTVMADRLLTDPDLYAVLLGSRSLPLSTTTRIKGKVRILKLFNVHVVSYSSCDIIIDVQNRSIHQQTCQYKTKI
ncbi:Harpin-induced [Heracleum sosnowskyi]|uniref:Harpin-induced n=1 Tax=Heracleum sosnowskyi TaxID=360622 RepID=A0AAD8MEK6_9APIA|nr:Harpin-induced [Heracleum sosnowskyi]